MRPAGIFQVQVISSVKKAIDILMLFRGNSHGLTLNEISKRTDLHKSSVHRTLGTLVASGIIEKDPVTGVYRPGLLILDLASDMLERFDFREQARPYLERLAGETGEIIHISILDGGEIIYLDKLGEAQPLTVATKTWGRYPAHCSAMGKVLLSGLSETELTEALGAGPYEKFTENTITDPDLLRKILACVKTDGYAVDDEEGFPGIRCVAAPVTGRAGKIVAAISASVPVQRMDEERTMRICTLLKNAAEKISKLSAAGYVAERLT